MINLLRTLSLGYIGQHRTRTVLVVLSIAIGVAAMVATQSLAKSLKSGLEDAVNPLAKMADLLVVKGTSATCDPINGCTQSSIHPGTQNEEVTIDVTQTGQTWWVIVDGKDAAKTSPYLIRMRSNKCSSSRTNCSRVRCISKRSSCRGRLSQELPQRSSSRCLRPLCRQQRGPRRLPRLNSCARYRCTSSFNSNKLGSKFRCAELPHLSLPLQQTPSSSVQMSFPDALHLSAPLQDVTKPHFSTCETLVLSLLAP